MPAADRASIRLRAYAGERDGDDGSGFLLLPGGGRAAPLEKEAGRLLEPWLSVELPSVLSYLPTGIAYILVLWTASIEHRVRVIDVYEDSLLRAYPRQQGDCAILATHWYMADGARQGRPGMSTVEFCIAPKSAIDQNYVAGVIHLPDSLRNFGERGRVGETVAIGFQQETQRRLVMVLCGSKLTRIIRQ